MAAWALVLFGVFLLLDGGVRIAVQRRRAGESGVWPLPLCGDGRPGTVRPGVAVLRRSAGRSVSVRTDGQKSDGLMVTFLETVTWSMSVTRTVTG